MRRWFLLPFVAMFVLGAGCDVSTSGDTSDDTEIDPDDYTVAEKLAIIHGDASTAGEFQRVIDCVMASGIEGAETEESVGDVLVASWEAKSQA